MFVSALFVFVNVIRIYPALDCVHKMRRGHVYASVINFVFGRALFPAYCCWVERCCTWNGMSWRKRFARQRIERTTCTLTKTKNEMRKKYKR